MLSARFSSKPALSLFATAGSLSLSAYRWSTNRAHTAEKIISVVTVETSHQQSPSPWPWSLRRSRVRPCHPAADGMPVADLVRCLIEPGIPVILGAAHLAPECHMPWTPALSRPRVPVRRYMPGALPNTLELRRRIRFAALSADPRRHTLIVGAGDIRRPEVARRAARIGTLPSHGRKHMTHPSRSDAISSGAVSLPNSVATARRIRSYLRPTSARIFIRSGRR
jgi:hypothetical protein